MWICCELLEPNVLPHSRHGNCRPDKFVCECRWFMRLRPSGKFSPHTLHATDLLRCDCMWRLSRALLKNDLPHFGQEWFFSLEWSHACFISVRSSLQSLPHIRHDVFVNSFSCVVAMCCRISSSRSNDSPHRVHLDFVFVFVFKEKSENRINFELKKTKSLSQ